MPEPVCSPLNYSVSLLLLPPDYLPKAIAGMEALAKNGLRYPFPQYGIQQDVRAGMAVSYPGRG